MKICIVCGQYAGFGRIGGFGTMARNLAEALQRAGHTVSVCVLRTAALEARQSLNGIPITAPHPAAFFTGSPVFKTFDADIFHSQEPTLGTFRCQRAHPDKGHVVTCIDPRDADDWAEEFRRFSLKKKALYPVIKAFEWSRPVVTGVRAADAVICQAKFIMPKVQRMYGVTREPAFIGHVHAFPAEAPHKAARPTVCFLARLDKRKRPELFFELARRFPQVNFIAIGKAHDGAWDAELRRRYAGLPNVEMLGYVDAHRSNTINEVLAKSWVLINTATREGLPAAFVEAASHRCAILATVNPDDFATNFGRYAEDPAALDGALESLLAGDAWRACGEAAYAYAREHFEESSVVRKHEALYTRVLDERARDDRMGGTSVPGSRAEAPSRRRASRGQGVGLPSPRPSPRGKGRGSSAMRIHLTGAWYSSRNAGDQAILITIRDLLAGALPEAELEVICARADFVRAEHGLAAVSQMRELPRVLWRVFRSDGLFIGGGTPFYDDFTHLAYFWVLARLCKLGGGKLVVYGASTQALKTRYGRFFTRSIMNAADLVTVREPVTAARLPALGVRVPVHCTADPAITLRPAEEARVEAILKAEGIDPERPLFAMCPHFFSNTDPYRVHHYEQFDDDPIVRQEIVLAALADGLAERGQVVFLPMNTDLPDSDVVVQRAIAARMENAKEAVFVETQYRPQEIAGVFSRCKLVVGVRLHALIMAAAVDTPIMAVDYAPKVRGFMQLLDEESHCHALKTLTFEALREGVEAYLADYDARAAALKDHAAALRARARENAAMAAALFRGRGDAGR